MTKPDWIFQIHPQNTSEENNISEEFFSNADVVGEVAGLVRESIQNSLDEVLDNTKPIKMVFTVGKQSPSVSQKYFGNLHPHIKDTPGLRDIPKLTQQAQFIAIEDLNTRGLEGPTVPTRPSENDLKNPKKPFKFSFWFFEWVTGESNKGVGNHGNRGTWGVGKIVFSRASKIKTYLVLSVRRKAAAPAGNTAILFGHAILKFRGPSEKRYQPNCRWMIKDEDKDLSVPSSDMTAQQEFIDDWNLTRKIGEMGTSIVVPFCQDSISADALAESIIRDYFISILGGQLECVVKGEGIEIVINKSSIIALLDGLKNEDLPTGARTKDELKTLCGMYLEFTSSSTTKLSIRSNSSDPNVWNEIKFADEDAKVVADAFSSGKTIELTVEVLVPAMTSPQLSKETDKFTVLLKGVSDLRPMTVFCREGILIPAAYTASKLQNCASIVLVGDMTAGGSIENSIANLLKKAEGPSHESWSPNATKFKDLYLPKTNAEATIRFVKASALRILRLIQGAENVEDDVTLSPYFPLSEDGGPIPGEIKVVLSGHRDLHNSDKALLSWRADGFTPISFVLKRLKPTELEVEKGIDAFGITSVDLDSGPDIEYRYQMTMTDGNKSYLSNFVTIKPLKTDPDPRTRAKVEIQKTKTGFRIVSQSGTALKDGYLFEVSAAYRAQRVNSMKWTEEDFLLSNQMRKPKTKGLKIVKEDDNYCQLEVTEPEIYAEWDEFDTLRDLIVKAEEI